MDVAGGVATTGIVKCFSKKFPKGKIGHSLIDNCKHYLKSQKIQHKPKLIICSGTEVSRFIEADFPPKCEKQNAYIQV